MIVTNRREKLALPDVRQGTASGLTSSITAWVSTFNNTDTLARNGD